jgi:ATP-dependent Lon protease
MVQNYSPSSLLNIKRKTMSKTLPLFPLQLVAFPEEKLNLHIFEPRYKQMITECHEQGTTFGIPAFIDGKVMNIGTEMQLVSIQETYANGEMDIKTIGLRIFETTKFYRKYEDKLYAAGDTVPFSYTREGDILTSRSIIEAIEELFTLLKIDKPIPEDPSTLFTFDLAHHVGFSVEQEYELLSIKEEVQRQQYMLDHLRKLIPTVREMKRLQDRVQMNGHFKNIIPPKV